MLVSEGCYDPGNATTSYGRTLWTSLPLPGSWWVQLKSSLGCHETQEADLSRVKFTFFMFHKQFILQKSLEHQPHLFSVIVKSSGEDQYVVQVDENKVVKHVAKNVINHGLKNSWGIRKAEGHHQILEMFKGVTLSSTGRSPKYEQDCKPCEAARELMI